MIIIPYVKQLLKEASGQKWTHFYVSSHNSQILFFKNVETRRVVHVEQKDAKITLIDYDFNVCKCCLERHEESVECLREFLCIGEVRKGRSRA